VAESAGEFVLDGSVTLVWFFRDEAHDFADAVRDGMHRSRALVPSLWPLEIANAIVIGERRKRSTPAQTAAWLGLLAELPIAVDDETTARAWSGTLNIARAHDLSAYDASYLELAMRRALPIASLDGKLKAAATAVGVPLFLSV
jgi:predicted nucleic acid-binding protein